jgi:CRP-like cAMP-binding protein
MTDCSLLRIEKKVIVLALTSQAKLANTVLAYVLASNIRYQQHLVDQRCNPSEKRLARILSLLAHFDRHGSTVADIPRINQETLAEMVGTTRSRVSFFMKKFRQSGFVDYEPGATMIRVHRTILAFYVSG